jgi:hypothetical protein
LSRNSLSLIRCRQCAQAINGRSLGSPSSVRATTCREWSSQRLLQKMCSVAVEAIKRDLHARRKPVVDRSPVPRATSAGSICCVKTLSVLATPYQTDTLTPARVRPTPLQQVSPHYPGMQA